MNPLQFAKASTRDQIFELAKSGADISEIYDILKEKKLSEINDIFKNDNEIQEWFLKQLDFNNIVNMLKKEECEECNKLWRFTFKNNNKYEKFLNKIYKGSLESVILQLRNDVLLNYNDDIIGYICRNVIFKNFRLKLEEKYIFGFEKSENEIKRRNVNIGYKTFCNYQFFITNIVSNSLVISVKRTFDIQDEIKFNEEYYAPNGPGAVKVCKKYE